MQMPEFLEKKYIGPVKGWHIAAGALVIIAIYMYKKKQSSTTSTGATTPTSSLAGGTASPSDYVGGGGGYFSNPLTNPGSITTIPNPIATAINPPVAATAPAATPVSAPAAPTVAQPIAPSPSLSQGSCAPGYVLSGDTCVSTVPGLPDYPNSFNFASNNLAGQAAQQAFQSSTTPAAKYNPPMAVSSSTPPFLSGTGTGPFTTNLASYAPGSSVYQAAGNENYLQQLGIYSSPMYSAPGVNIQPNSSGYNYSGTPLSVGAYQPSSQSNVLGQYVETQPGVYVFQT